MTFPGPFLCEKPGTPRFARPRPGVPPLAKAPISSISTGGVLNHPPPPVVVSIPNQTLKQRLNVWWVGLESRAGDYLARVSEGRAPRARITKNNLRF